MSVILALQLAKGTKGKKSTNKSSQTKSEDFNKKNKMV
jgi:hypothetical protein